jgi:L-ascorbate metabolism protein UlaG (beta-lactamase superfamily)
MAEDSPNRPVLPGYGPAAAKSTLRRYPKHLAGHLAECMSDHLGERVRSLAGAPRGAGAETRPVEGEPIEALAQAGLGAMWLGHATVLLRLDGRWILTDPVFSSRIGVRVGPVTLGVPRLLPAFDPGTLPPIDLVMISHAHFDHLDRPTLKALAHSSWAHRTRVVTARGTKRLIPRGFGDTLEVDWHEAHTLDGIDVRALRPRHWGARTIWDRRRGFNSYVLSAVGTRVLYAGDTAASDVFRGLGPMDLSIFGIGAYDPWIHAHASPEEVWRMHKDSGARTLLPMHHSTFELSDEPLDEPLRRLLAAAGSEEGDVVCRELGGWWLRAHAN